MNSDALINWKKSRRSDCMAQSVFDDKYNVNTSCPIREARDGSGEMVPSIIENDKVVPGSTGFQNTAEPQIDLINNYLKEIITPEEYSFVDLGCGKGKVLLYNQVTGANYKELIGVELDEDLYKIAVANTNSIPGPIIYNKNLLDYELPENKCIIFVFNPTHINIWLEFLKNKTFNYDTIIVSVFGFGNCDENTFIVLDEPELKFGFTKIYEKDLIYFYRKNV